MDIINYHPWTLIYLSLPPSVGVIANWPQWSEDETNLIIKVKQDNPSKKITIINFILPQMKVPTVGIDGIESLGKANGASRVINYTVPQSINNQKKNIDLNNFEPLKNMFHLKKIYILENHPLLKQLKKIYQPSQIIIIEPTNLKIFLNQLKNDLNHGNLENYRHLVGANYSFKGPVIHGNASGKKIGYPTANLLIKPPLPIKSGVYLVKVNLPNEEKKRWGLGDYRKLANHNWIFETFILDFNQEIYDWLITIELVAFHRINVPFESFEQIKLLIKSDEIALRSMIAKIKEK